MVEQWRWPMEDRESGQLPSQLCSEMYSQLCFRIWNRWMDKEVVVHIHMEYYSAMKRNAFGIWVSSNVVETLHIDITRWSIPKSDWLYSIEPKMEKLYTVSKNKTGSWLCSDHELLIAKFRLKLKKVGKTTRPFRYDVNQIPYDYTVEVTDSRD